MEFNTVKFVEENSEFLDALSCDLHDPKEILKKIELISTRTPESEKITSLCTVARYLEAESKENCSEKKVLEQIADLLAVKKIVPPMIEELIYLRKNGNNTFKEGDIAFDGFERMWDDIERISDTEEVFYLHDEIRDISENNFELDGLRIIPTMVSEFLLKELETVSEYAKKKAIEEKCEGILSDLNMKAKRLDYFIYNSATSALKKFCRENNVFFGFSVYGANEIAVFYSHTREEVSRENFVFKRIQDIVKIISRDVYLYFSIDSRTNTWGNDDDAINGSYYVSADTVTSMLLEGNTSFKENVLNFGV